jgi:hypothetical protein
LDAVFTGEASKTAFDRSGAGDEDLVEVLAAAPLISSAEPLSFSCSPCRGRVRSPAASTTRRAQRDGLRSVELGNALELGGAFSQAHRLPRPASGDSARGAARAAVSWRLAPSLAETASGRIVAGEARTSRARGPASAAVKSTLLASSAPPTCRHDEPM